MKQLGQGCRGKVCLPLCLGSLHCTRPALEADRAAVWAPKRLRQTFEALLNIFTIAEASLEKSVHQMCALPGHPAAQVLYFLFFIF